MIDNEYRQAFLEGQISYLEAQIARLQLNMERLIKEKELEAKL